jgi:7-cyano-7-deazaguanine synthase
LLLCEGELKMESATVLLSGGLDSTVLLHHVVRELGAGPVYALSFQYGQKHGCELEMARWQAASLGAAVAEHRVLDLGFFGELAGGASSLVTGGPDVPALSDLKAADLDQPMTYVPNRNMMLLSLAAAFAEARGCGVLYYGAQAQDEYGYWDCTTEFVERINAVLALNRRRPVRVVAPFAQKRKSEGVALGVKLGVDFSRTWSCYRGGERPCGECPTCVERRKAFEEAGVRDPLDQVADSK